MGPFGRQSAASNGRKCAGPVNAWRRHGRSRVCSKRSRRDQYQRAAGDGLIRGAVRGWGALARQPDLGWRLRAVTGVLLGARGQAGRKGSGALPGNEYHWYHGGAESAGRWGSCPAGARSPLRREGSPGRGGPGAQKRVLRQQCAPAGATAWAVWRGRKQARRNGSGRRRRWPAGVGCCACARRFPGISTPGVSWDARVSVCRGGRWRGAASAIAPFASRGGAPSSGHAEARGGWEQSPRTKPVLKAGSRVLMYAVCEMGKR